MPAAVPYNNHLNSRCLKPRCRPHHLARERKIFIICQK
jgi:hypothetical protein